MAKLFQSHDLNLKKKQIATLLCIHATKANVLDIINKDKEILILSKGGQWKSSHEKRENRERHGLLQVVLLDKVLGRRVREKEESLG